MAHIYSRSAEEPSAVHSIDEVFLNATNSIQYAEIVMARTQGAVQKAQTSKDGRNKAVAKASEIVNALLEPAAQVANLLDGLGGGFPPCKLAGNVLAALVKLEVDRRDNDIRVVLVYLDMATTLVTLGSLKPGFQTVTTLVGPLGNIIDKICGLMKEFGQFSEAFYDAKALKSKLKHLLHSKSNRDRLADFQQQLVLYKTEINTLLSHQAVLILVSHTEALARLETGLSGLRRFYASVSDADEDSAVAFVEKSGGEEAVQSDTALLEQLAEKLGEKLTTSVCRAVQESAEDSFRQTQASFMLKFQFALEQRIDESQEMILNELKSGPYELIRDPDVKVSPCQYTFSSHPFTYSSCLTGNLEKYGEFLPLLTRKHGTHFTKAAKESSVKRRQFIDALNYHFNIQFKKYKTEHNRAEREDAWTKAIVSKVQFHPSIGDAIDDDASGYISVEEINDFLRRKPATWTVPQWVAYWAYGWDADNFVYQGKIDKAYKQLEKIRDAGGPNAAHVKSYLDETQERIATFAGSVYSMRELDPPAAVKMDKLRDEWREACEKAIKQRLRAVNYKMDYSSVNAIAGSERLEATFLPLASMLLARHLSILRKPEVSEEDAEEASESMLVLIDMIRERIGELKAIWRRQRIDVDTQIRYYANGMLEDYYKKYRKEEFDTDNEGDSESSWDSEDEWKSEDSASGEPAMLPAAQQPARTQIPPRRTVDARGAGNDQMAHRSLEIVESEDEEVPKGRETDEEEGEEQETQVREGEDEEEDVSRPAQRDADKEEDGEENEGDDDGGGNDAPDDGDEDEHEENEDEGHGDADGERDGEGEVEEDE
ncbi:hypothetical protein BV25DRAFT_1921375 [Artomyces pyxidatus]|uniref:Uncharacterized protein n=1 Tax=Artomyces pyxidatus TaxID=48021 RepID=A0ACB8SHW0_9AGAM|nr:hypothetical protein BV25DRAFT_1921375 [Artomyces pyxidatus]